MIISLSPLSQSLVVGPNSVVDWRRVKGFLVARAVAVAERTS